MSSQLEHPALRSKLLSRLWADFIDPSSGESLTWLRKPAKQGSWVNASVRPFYTSTSTSLFDCLELGLLTGVEGTILRYLAEFDIAVSAVFCRCQQPSDTKPDVEVTRGTGASDSRLECFPVMVFTRHPISTAS